MCELTKNEFRNKYSKLTINSTEKSDFDLQISNIFFKSNLISEYSNFLIYISTDQEVSTIEIINNLLALNKNVYVPKCLDNKGNMEFYKIDCLDELTIGRYGILEPVDTKIPFELKEKSLIVVPAICFDVRGYRVGHGKGYYDRYLNKINCLKVGLCYNYKLLDEVPFDIHDEKVDCIVTENSFINIIGDKLCIKELQ